MSKPYRSAQQIQQEYAEACTKLGQSNFAEKEAQREQQALSKLQKELADEFKGVAQREREEELQKAKAEAATKAFEAKAEDTPQTDTPAST